MNNRSKLGVPKNTERRNTWAVNTWTKWSIARNNTRQFQTDGSDAPSDKWTKLLGRLVDLSVEELQYWLSKFILEVRKEDGTDYPPRSLLSLVMGIQSYLRIETKQEIDFLNSKDYLAFRQLLDAEMKRLSQKGLGSNVRKAEPFSVSDENKLWSSKALGDFNPRILVRTVHFLNGKNFGLRGGQEHRRLRYKPSQITLHEPAEITAYLKYSEDVSKTCQGGLKHRKLTPKEIVHYANRQCPERCHVRIYKKYIQLSPKDGRDSAFYVQPLLHPREHIWFSRQAIGTNTLAKFTSETCDKAGVSGYHTNHSLRATTATRLFNSGIDEQLIMSKTGHRSVEGID